MRVSPKNAFWSTKDEIKGFNNIQIYVPRGSLSGLVVNVLDGGIRFWF